MALMRNSERMRVVRFPEFLLETIRNAKSVCNERGWLRTWKVYGFAELDFMQEYFPICHGRRLTNHMGQWRERRRCVTDFYLAWVKRSFF